MKKTLNFENKLNNIKMIHNILKTIYKTKFKQITQKKINWQLNKISSNIKKGFIQIKTNLDNNCSENEFYVFILKIN